MACNLLGSCTVLPSTGAENHPKLESEGGLWGIIAHCWLFSQNIFLLGERTVQHFEFNGKRGVLEYVGMHVWQLSETTVVVFHASKLPFAWI